MGGGVVHRLDVFIEFLAVRILYRCLRWAVAVVVVAVAADVVAQMFGLWRREITGFVMASSGVVLCATVAALLAAVAIRNSIELLHDRGPLLHRLWGIVLVACPLLFGGLFLAGAVAAFRSCWDFW